MSRWDQQEQEWKNKMTITCSCLQQMLYCSIFFCLSVCNILFEMFYLMLQCTVSTGNVLTEALMYLLPALKKMNPSDEKACIIKTSRCPNTLFDWGDFSGDLRLYILLTKWTNPTLSHQLCTSIGFRHLLCSAVKDDLLEHSDDIIVKVKAHCGSGCHSCNKT